MAVDKLPQAARTAIALAKPKKSERFLIVTDIPTLRIGEALFDAASKQCEAYLVGMPPTGRHGMEPPKLVSEAMLASDIVYCATQYSLTHTNASREAAKGARVATLPGITEGTLIRGMGADYSRIRKTNAKLEKLMKTARKIRVVAQDTDFIVERGARRIFRDEASVRQGHVINLPGGETGFAPIEFNGYFTGSHGKVKNKTFKVEHNKVVHIADSKLQEQVWKIKNARKIAEFAIGTNPGAMISGCTLEDEKVLGTCHVAIGDSKSLGGTTDAPIHWDFIIKKPSIWFGEKQVMKKGKML